MGEGIFLQRVFIIISAVQAEFAVSDCFGNPLLMLRQRTRWIEKDVSGSIFSQSD